MHTHTHKHINWCKPIHLKRTQQVERCTFMSITEYTRIHRASTHTYHRANTRFCILTRYKCAWAAHTHTHTINYLWILSFIHLVAVSCSLNHLLCVFFFRRLLLKSWYLLSVLSLSVLFSKKKFPKKFTIFCERE